MKFVFCCVCGKTLSLDEAWVKSLNELRAENKGQFVGTAIVRSSALCDEHKGEAKQAYRLERQLDLVVSEEERRERWKTAPRKKPSTTKAPPRPPRPARTPLGSWGYGI